MPYKFIALVVLVFTSSVMAQNYSKIQVDGVSAVTDGKATIALLPTLVNTQKKADAACQRLGTSKAWTLPNRQEAFVMGFLVSGLVYNGELEGKLTGQDPFRKEKREVVMVFTKEPKTKNNVLVFTGPEYNTKLVPDKKVKKLSLSPLCVYRL